MQIMNDYNKTIRNTDVYCNITITGLHTERLQLRNNQDILCMEGVGGKVKRDAKFFGVACAENGV